MSENFRYYGKFWLPSNPKKKISGEFTFLPGRQMNLTLYGFFEEISDDISELPIKMIYMKTDFNQKITLMDCVPYDIQGNGEVVRLDIYKAFFGFHFSNPKSVLYTQISVRFNNIDDWLFFDCFKSNWNNYENRNEISIHFHDPKGIEFDLDKYIKIKFGLKTRGVFREKSSISLEYKSQITFSSLNPIAIDYYLEKILVIRKFLTFSMSKPIKIIEMNGYTTGKKNQNEQRIIIGIPQNLDESEEWDTRMLFSFKNIEANCATIIKKWFENMELCKPVYDLYLSAISNPNILLENKFLMFTQALEAYHRRKIDGKYQTNDDYLNGLYKKFAEIIPENLDASFKESLINGKLYYANEFSFRKRLSDLINLIPKDFPLKLVNNNKNRQEFIENIIHNRNHLTHYDKDEKRFIPNSPQVLKMYIEKMQIILEIYFFLDLGFVNEEIRKMVFLFKKCKHDVA